MALNDLLFLYGIFWGTKIISFKTLLSISHSLGGRWLGVTSTYMVSLFNLSIFLAALQFKEDQTNYNSLNS